MRRWRWGLAILIMAGVAGGLTYLLFRNSPKLRDQAKGVFRRGRTVRVEVVRPETGGLEKVCTQPGTVVAFESVELFAEASGYLKRQTVDLGDVVKKGAMLAEVDVPDLDKAVLRARAVLGQAQAKVGQMKASVERARADARAAKAAIKHAESMQVSASGTRRFRAKEHERMMDLHQKGGLERRLVDEAEDRREAAVAAEKAAAAAIDTAKAQEAAAGAKIDQALADVTAAEAEVEVARADVDRAAVMVNFAKVVAPFDGVITRRTLFPGGFVRSAKEGERTPLLGIARTDRVRVVVQVPDREAPYADRGDPASVEVDALRGKTFRGYISRSQSAQDPETRTMRVEVDLDNPRGELRPGMFGRVTISLQKASDGLSLPSGCLVGRAREGQGSVFCVRDGKALLVPVRTGVDNGVRVEVVAGLSANDQVIRRYSGTLTSGMAVEVTPSPDAHENK